MIYNLVTHLRTSLPSLTFVVDGWNESSASDSLLVTDSGGTDDHNTGRRDCTVQVKSRSQSMVVAKENVQAVYDELHNRFGMTLAEVTVNSVTYPSLVAYRIVPIQRPGYLGMSDENYHMYSFNVIVTLDYS